MPPTGMANANAPKTAGELQQLAQKIEVNNILPLKYYFRSCDNLLKQVRDPMPPHRS